MLISELGIKGYKSFGNNEQTLKLNTVKGDLILLSGVNGSGKSSIIESVEYTLYNKVRSGKVKKWNTLSSLPNRINGELLNTIKFNSNNIEVEVKRGINPDVLELWENGVKTKKKGSGVINSAIEEYIGMDIETFKSFISMSINDFKNFISLSNEDKKLLLDKLFNLEAINILNNILKEIVKDNKRKMDIIDSEISSYENSITSIKTSIDNAKRKEAEDNQDKIDELKREMASRKDEYRELKDKQLKIVEKNKILSTELDSERRQMMVIQNDIQNVQKELNLYDQGKCPTCSTDFNTSHFLDLKSVLLDKKKGFEDILEEVKNNITEVRRKQTKLDSISSDVNKSFNDLDYLLRSHKSKIEDLMRKQNIKSESINITEFKKSIDEIEIKKKESKAEGDVCKEKELYYKELRNIFSEDGVKKSIISGIIKPINYFIRENIKQMMLPFEVSLDDTFTAEIRHLGEIIAHDSLSTGETKKINLSIIIAYLKLIRTKKHINVLFLDEVFSSIDLEGIDSILRLLRSFANDYNVNIFVVHHAILNEDMFDRILKVNKDIFSNIEEVNLNEINEYEKNEETE